MSFNDRDHGVSMTTDEIHRKKRRQRNRLPEWIPIENPKIEESTRKNSRRRSSFLKSEFPERVGGIAQEELVYPVRNDAREHIYVVNLAEVQRLNLYALRKELAEEV